MQFDKIIIGAGLYGLYAAEFCGRRKEKILVLECDSEPFLRATYINQARVHMGYHYPRSYSTAIKSAKYFDRFNKDYSFCINSQFDKVYATSSSYSWTSAEQFIKFCHDAEIPCDYISPDKYFKPGLCDGAFITKEYTYDALLLRDYLVEKIRVMDNVTIWYNVNITEIVQDTENYHVLLNSGVEFLSGYILNATYASVNQILSKCKFPLFSIKYELCEIILCNVNSVLEKSGITVMDGPFFSIMPFGKSGLHSLTSVTFTPHKVCFDERPTFDCQKRSEGYCSFDRLGNCNLCKVKPDSAWSYMSTLARKYLKDEYEFEYRMSLFSMKPILKVSEVDDSRPTVIRVETQNPVFVSVLSGKINTVYDLDEVLINDNR